MRYQFTFITKACFIIMLGLAACSGDTEQTGLDTTLPTGQEQGPKEAADELYRQATAALDRENYQKAASLFEELERQYPYSRWATQSQLMAAYAIYSNKDYIGALASLDRFIELHPGHKDIAYAYYLKALSYYEQISDVKRDQSRTRQALDTLNTVIRRFPETKYARDARFKRDLTLNHLAGREMEVGRFYLKRNQVNAAINRFQNVVENYQTTTHVPEALHRLVESYRILGLEGQARRIAAVLGYNYPSSRWYEYSYRLFDENELENLQKNKGWLDLGLDSLFSSDDSASKSGPGKSQ